MKLSNTYKILFLLIVVLGVYYPAIFAKTAIVDDDKMLFMLSESGPVTFKGLFLPGNGYYYRPILLFTFIADKWLWGLDPSFIHLENILLHAVNVILVFFVAKKLYKRLDIDRDELPLLCALLFALHPINTEAVNWISGRTDLLAGTFVLLSTIALLNGLSKTHRGYIFLSAILLLGGALAKEVAVFFFPAACLLLIYWPHEQQDFGWAQKLRQLIVFGAPFIAIGIFYLALRLVAFKHGDATLTKLLNNNGYDLYNSLRVFFKVFGFYVKKLVLPLPLNFITDNFSNHYVWLGLASFIAIIFFVRRRNLLSALLLAVFCLIFPALLVALFRVAWTPVAERYLYVPVAFFIIAVVGYLYGFVTKRKSETVLVGILVLLLIPATVFTAQRTLIWQDSVKLYQDCARKSPNSIFAKNELALALMESGRRIEADKVLDVAIQKNKNTNYALFHLNQSQLRLKEGDYAAARALLLQTFDKKEMANVEVLKMLTVVDEVRLRKSSDKAECVTIARELIDTHKYLYPKTRDPVGLYRSGQLALFIGDKRQAAELFADAHRLAPESAFYKDAAGKLAEKCLNR